MDYVMAKELAKQYDPKEVEDRTYKFWLDGNFFHAGEETLYYSYSPSEHHGSAPYGSCS